MSEEDTDMGAAGRVIRCLHPVFMVGALYEDTNGAEGSSARGDDMRGSADVREHDASRDSEPTQRDPGGREND